MIFDSLSVCTHTGDAEVIHIVTKMPFGDVIDARFERGETNSITIEAVTPRVKTH